MAVIFRVLCWGTVNLVLRVLNHSKGRLVIRFNYFLCLKVDQLFSIVFMRATLNYSKTDVQSSFVSEVTLTCPKNVLYYGTCFPHPLQYLLEEQMTVGYDLHRSVMMDCTLQALLMISKCVNYSLTFLLLSFKDSFHSST